MFKRITYDEWQEMVPLVAFLLTFGVFLFFLIRAIRMRKSDAEYMSKLPLQQDPEKPAQK